MLKGVTIKLDSTIYDSPVELDGYSLVRRDRVNKLGAGVCAYIKSSIPFKVLPDLQDEFFESLWLYIRPYKLPRGFSCLIVCVIYHPPANDNNALIDHNTSKLDLQNTPMQESFWSVILIDVPFHYYLDISGFNLSSSNPQGKTLP